MAEKLKYGVMRIDHSSGSGSFRLQSPKIGVSCNRSGLGEAKEFPCYMSQEGIPIKRFKTEEKAVNYYKKYKRKVNKYMNDYIKLH